MNKKETTILEPIKKTIAIVVMVVIMILILFAYLQYQTRHREYEDKLIINVFGKQRMYTQMLSKDSSHLYALLQSKEDGTNVYQSKEQIIEKITKVKAGMSLTIGDFSNTLKAIHNNKLNVNSHQITIDTSIINSSGNLKKIDELWSRFNQSVGVMIDAKKMDGKMSEAAIYIDENNMALLNQCDSLLNQILDDSIRDDKTMQYLSYGLISLLIIVLIVALYELQHFLIQPFGQLYKGIADIGLSSYSVKSSLPANKGIMPIVTEIKDMFYKINSLISLIENVNNNDSFMETLTFIRDTFSPFIPYNYIGIALISEDKKYLRASYGVSDGTILGLPEKIRGTTWLIRETSMGVLIDTGEVRIINDLEKYCKDRPLKSYNQVIIEAGIKASITLPLSVSGKPVGMIFFSSSSKNVYTIEHINFLRTLANSIAICLNQNIFVSDILYSSILALAKLAEARDEDTGEHLDRMSIYSRAIAEMLYENYVYTDHMSLEYIDDIERFSPLHDIGKVGIRDGILLKPSKLTTEEFEEMKQHTTFGAGVLRSAEKNMQKSGKTVFHMGFEIAESHHERWDGTGYPDGKKGEEIPLSARIVAVADVFDALTSKRPYKEAFSIDKAIDIITEGRGNHFDPVIVDILLDNRSKIDNIYHRFKTVNITE